MPRGLGKKLDEFRGIELTDGRLNCLRHGVEFVEAVLLFVEMYIVDPAFITDRRK